MDLFAGPGKYKDDTPSTPVIVLQTAIKDPRRLDTQGHKTLAFRVA